MGNFQTCGPNEVMVVSGLGHGGEPLTISGGRSFVFSCIQKCDYLSLNAITLEIVSNAVNSELGVPVNAKGVAQVRINNSDVQLKIATQLYLGVPQRQIEDVARQTLEGHQRAMIGNMTVETMFRDKNAFAEQVRLEAEKDLGALGFQVISYTLKELSDDNGYLEALGRPEIAETHSRQKISEDMNRRDADVRKAEALARTKESQFAAELEKTKAKMALDLQTAKNQEYVGVRQATADMANRLQDAITRQEVILQEMQIKVVEKERQIKVQDEEVKRKRQQLSADVIKPAEAASYKVMQQAEAAKNKVILEAQGEAQRIELKGAAEAEAIKAKALAEAEKLKLKAEAFAQFREAALVDVVLDVMPKVAAEIAAPMQNIKNVNMVSSGNGQIGANRMAKEVLDIMESLPAVVFKLTGVDISKDIKAITGK